VLCKVSTRDDNKEEFVLLETGDCLEVIHTATPLRQKKIDLGVSPPCLLRTSAIKSLEIKYGFEPALIKVNSCVPLPGTKKNGLLNANHN
jgi:hypothetical protein